MPAHSDSDGLKAAFAHVLWIGGPSDAGKSTVARFLAERHRWQIYPCDFHEHNHFFARADPEPQPTMVAWTRKSLDERWVYPTLDRLFRIILCGQRRALSDDLRGRERDAEATNNPRGGARLFPKLVAPLLSSPQQAVWLMPTEEFARQSIARRDKPQARFQSSDPERFRRNFLRREALLAEHIQQEVAAYGLPSIQVDGRQSVEDVARRVEAHFAPYLALRQVSSRGSMVDGVVPTTRGWFGAINCPGGLP